MQIKKPACGLFPLTGLMALAACGGGGGGANAAPAGNLTVDSVRLESTNPNAAHEMTLSATITATTRFENVPVTYVLLNKEDVDAERDPVRQHEVTSSVFSTVEAGTQGYETYVTIPAEAREAGEYYLVPHLDPANSIPETDEEDNEPTDGSKVEIAIGSANTDRADVVLESVAIDQGAVILYPFGAPRPPLQYVDPRDPNSGVRQASDVANHDFDATLEATTTGSRELQALDITATIIVPGTGEMELRFWDPDNDQYLNEIHATVTPGIPTTVNMDVWIPGGTRRAIDTHLRAGRANTFEVVFSSNMTAGIAEWENGVNRHSGRSTGSDNRISTEIVIVLPSNETSPCNELLWTADYEKVWKNKAFGIGVDFEGNASLDPRGAIGRARAAVPVRLFGIDSDAIALEAFGRVTPRENLPTDSEFNLDFKMFGFTLYSESNIDPSVSYDREESVTKTYERRGFVFAGPVPIQLLARASATMGYRVHAFLDPALLEVEGQIFGRAQAFASASVNVVVLEAGVAGSITLIDDVFTARARCQLGIPSGGQLTGTLTLEAINELTGPNGRLYVYEEHSEPKWCWEVVPCGLRRIRNEKTLARFRSFEKTDVLFHDTETRTVCVR